MKKILHHIRNKPKQVRTTLAVILAFACTGVIAVLWVGTFSVTKKPGVQNAAPSPFNALGATIKSTVKNADWTPNASNQVKTEIIDVGADTMHDETNPYQTPIQ